MNNEFADFEIEALRAGVAKMSAVELNRELTRVQDAFCGGEISAHSKPGLAYLGELAAALKVKTVDDSPIAHAKLQFGDLPDADFKQQLAANKAAIAKYNKNPAGNTAEHFHTLSHERVLLSLEESRRIEVANAARLRDEA